VLRGTHRVDRHGALSLSTVDSDSQPYDWEPTAEDVAKLGPAGRQFVEDAVRRHEFNFSAGWLLLDVASTFDLLAQLSRDIDERGILLRGSRGAMRPNPSVRHHLRASRWIAEQLRHLNIK
jgi:hypothetical protein